MTSDIRRLTSNIRHMSQIGSLTSDFLTPDIWLQTSDVWHLTSDTRHIRQQTSDITYSRNQTSQICWHQTSDIRHQTYHTSDVWHLTSWHQTSDIRHQTSDFWHQTPDIYQISNVWHQTSYRYRKSEVWHLGTSDVWQQTLLKLFTGWTLHVIKPEGILYEWLRVWHDYEQIIPF